MSEATTLPSRREHIVWLDIVRFVAMFTVVCSHSADPFNFFTGEAPANLNEIKFWGCGVSVLSASLCPPVCHDYRHPVIAGQRQYGYLL